jgi:predicted lipoprotein with Yx(FWY)xxD motif
MVAVVLLASACSNSGTAVTAPFGNSLPLEHGPSYEVKARNVSGLGPLLVDGQGITLYVFSTDHQGSPSRCYDICAVQWPPLTLPRGVVAPIAGLGIRTPLLGTAPRTDGTTQITYNGWPLYLWPPDDSPGKATGQALTNAGGRWYVINPTGNALQPH